MNKLLVLTTSLIAFLAFSQPTYAKSTSVKTKAAAVQPQQKINLNKAGANEIADALTGVGMKKALAIVEYRKKHGKFKAIEDIAAVKGIGVATLAKNQGRIVL